MELARRQQVIVQASQRETQTVLTGLQKRRDAERAWSTGTQTAFNDYIDHATNAAEQANTLFTDAFKNMEGALVSFVMNGKLDFTSLANSIIADIVRIQIRSALAGAAGSTSGFFSGLFGGSAGASTGASEDFGLTGSEFHAGGVVGIDGRPRRVSAAYFHDAPRYHLGVDEVPAILQRGETVLPRGAKGDTYYVDARGADTAAIARLEKAIRMVNGSIEYRAVGAVQREWNRRGAVTPMG